MKRLNFNIVNNNNQFESSMFLNFDTNIYSKYIGRIKLIESEKHTKDLIFSQEEAYIFKKAYIKKHIKVANPTED